MATAGSDSDSNRKTIAPHRRIIGVHVLTEFVYCPRAGLAQFEEDRIDQRDGQTPRLDYLPEYELQKIITKRLRVIWKIYALLCMLVVFAILAGLLGWLIHKVFYLSWLVGTVFLSYLLIQYSYRAILLTMRLNDYYRAERGAPPADLQRDMVVNWWSILKDGFDCLSGRTTADHRLGIRGRSYYVLRRGSLAIPVFMYSGKAERVRRQDRVRIAAYCHLLAVNEGADCPYGILLRPGSDEVVAIPNNWTAQRMLREALDQFREVIRLSVEAGEDPPENDRGCRDCPIGRPRRYDPRKPKHLKYGQPLRRNLCGSDWVRTYHSHCGDRFEWIPPHQIARERGWIE